MFAVALPSACAHGTFVAPTVIAIDDPKQLTREVFGPVLHVLRFREGRLPQLIDALNATGYGLTHGIHTRIDETVDLVAQRIRAGNVYVNRNIVGAVVGVQPFGGEGLSGTGPKAGGPHYLRRLVVEQRPVTAEEMTVTTELPGPTGETNTLRLHPRGRIACIAATEAAMRAQAMLAASLGNVPVLPPTPAALRVRAAVGGQCEIAADVLLPPPAAVLFDGSEDEAAALRVVLAAGDGPLVPLLVARDGAYASARLVCERTLTINTTASGGNATLLSLEEREPA